MSEPPVPEQQPRWQIPMTPHERRRYIRDHVKEFENPRYWEYIGDLIDEREV